MLRFMDAPTRDQDVGSSAVHVLSSAPLADSHLMPSADPLPALLSEVDAEPGEVIQLPLLRAPPAVQG